MGPRGKVRAPRDKSPSELKAYLRTSDLHPDMRGPIPDLDDQGDLGEQFVPTQIQEQETVTNEQVLCSFVLF